MKVSIMQWNVWYREPIENILEFLKASDCDIYCLQELTIGSPVQAEHKNTVEFLQKALGFHVYSKEIPIEDTKGNKVLLLNGIFSRFPIKQTHWKWINEEREGGGFSDEYRAYIEAKVDIGTSELTIGTTHMSYTHRFEETARKREETDLLMDAIRGHQRYVFTGDLNALPGSYTIRSLEGVLNNSGPAAGEKTWATKPFSYQGFEEDELNWRLDYIFTTPDIKVLKSEILHTPFSDHLPIRAELEIN